MTIMDKMASFVSELINQSIRNLGTKQKKLPPALAAKTPEAFYYILLLTMPYSRLYLILGYTPFLTMNHLTRKLNQHRKADGFAILTFN